MDRVELAVQTEDRHSDSQHIQTDSDQEKTNLKAERGKDKSEQFDAESQTDEVRRVLQDDSDDQTEMRTRTNAIVSKKASYDRPVAILTSRAINTEYISSPAPR